MSRKWWETIHYTFWGLLNPIVVWRAPPKKADDNCSWHKELNVSDTGSSYTPVLCCCVSSVVHWESGPSSPELFHLNWMVILGGWFYQTLVQMGYKDLRRTLSTFYSHLVYCNAWCYNNNITLDKQRQGHTDIPVTLAVTRCLPNRYSQSACSWYHCIHTGFHNNNNNLWLLSHRSYPIYSLKVNSTGTPNTHEWKKNKQSMN